MHAVQVQRYVSRVRFVEACAAVPADALLLEVVKLTLPRDSQAEGGRACGGAGAELREPRALCGGLRGGPRGRAAAGGGKTNPAT